MSTIRCTVLGLAAAVAAGGWAGPKNIPWDSAPPGMDTLLWWWGVAAGGSLLGLPVLWIWRRRVRRLMESKRALELAVAERTAEIERLLEEARQASRLKGEFLANISHEIRTPMNGVISMAALALETDLTEEQREYLTSVKVCADSLLRLLNEVLDFSKIEAGRLELEHEPISIQDCLERAVRIVASSARDKNVGLALDLDSRIPSLVVGDAQRLEQVLVNLLSNALKFTSEGCVTLRATLESAGPPALRVRFAVEDTGIGIAPDKLQSIFQPFVQADESVSRRYGGSGLGLAICSRLVKLLDGELGVESEPGAGSRFFFSASFATAEPHLPAGEPAASRPCPRVLVVEDNAVSRRVAERMLEKQGYRVDVAENGRAALERLEREAYDLVLMDVQMPELDGIAVTRTIRAREIPGGRHTPILMLTASALAGDRQNCLEAGADGFLIKPIHPGRLSQSLESVLGPRKPGGTANAASMAGGLR